MKKTHSTKRALLSAILALVMTVSMLVGTTFAWFTDSVTSANNVIKSGNLDVTLEYYNGTEWKDVKDSSEILDKNAKWEPGRTEVIYLKLENAGSLAFKYQFGINIVSETKGKNVAGDDLVLSDYIYFATKETASFEKFADRDAAMAITSDSTLISKGFNKAGELTADAAPVYIAMVIYMPETLGNVANHDGTNVPEISLGINVVATQLASEKDSFGPSYDNKAPIVGAPEQLPAQGEALELNSSVESNVNVSVPATVIDEIKTAVGATAMSVAASAPIVDETNNTVTFETLELVDQDGKEIDLTAAGISAKVTVKLPVNGAFADGEEVAIYHDGQFVTYVKVADGYITYEVGHFCEVTVKKLEDAVADEKININVVPDESGVLVIDNALQLMAFANEVNAGNSYAGKTVLLGADIDLAGISWTPIGNSTNSFNGIFDGQKHTISNLSVLMAGKSYVGLFGMTQNGEVKNLTVENAKVVGRLSVGVVAGSPYTTKYTNITVKGHVEVDGFAYVGGVGGRNAYANWDNITVDVDGTSYVSANSTENDVAYRTYVGGVIGFMGEGSHKVSNVKSNINVIGSTIDVGGVVGIAHYGNNFENVSCSGDVKITSASEAAEAEEIGGIAGVWHNETGYTVTMTNCTYTGALSVNVENVDLANNIIAGAPYGATGKGELIIGGVYGVSNADALVKHLEAGEDVFFVSDIKIDPANMSNAYGKTGINVKKGQMIDGCGYTLNISGASGTWDSGINTTGGTIKNLTVTGSFRGVFINHNINHAEKVVLENVVITGTVYTISCDQGSGNGFEAKGSTFNGWTSYAKTLGAAKFTDCSFGEGNGYAYCRPYVETTFVGCDFAEGYQMDAVASVTFENCTIAGKPLTAENLSTLVTSNIANASVK